MNFPLQREKDMQKNQVAVLDFGSEKLRALFGERGVNNTFVIKGSAYIDYSGFYDGEFLEPDELASKISEAVDGIRENGRIEVDKIFVGVPGEFVTSVLREKSISFPKKKKINETDVEELFAAASNFKSERYTVINKSAIYYVLGDNRRVVEPLGFVSEKLGGFLSYVLADRYFINKITPLLASLGFAEIEYVSSTLAESMFLFEPEIRDRFALLADVGYLTSSVVLIRGDGILYQKSFSYGGGHITADLSHYLGADFDIAEALKRRINVGCKAEGGAVYEIVREPDVLTFPVAKANEIVCSALDNLCELIDSCLAKCPVKFPDYLTLYLTGGGVSYMRGCKEYISKRLNRVTEVIAPNLPNLNKPTQSSELGLLNMALKQNAPKPGLFKKLFG